MNNDVGTGNEGACLTLADLDYALPNGLIAQQPLPRRDASRLLVLDRTTGRLHDSRIRELPALLEAGDLLVLNDTKVLPAKFTARRATGAQIGGLFVREIGSGQWEVMLEKSRRLRVGESLTLTGREQDGSVTLELLESTGPGFWRVGTGAQGSTLEILSRVGVTPLPPYIRREEGSAPSDNEDRSRYQTVYARNPGAIAAPTAGLHLSNEILDEIHARRVETMVVTLHVGVGTFKPIEVENVPQHRMHAEWYELKPEAADAVQRCRRRSGRVVAVGTTSVRVLETAAAGGRDTRTVQASSGNTELFIFPPYRFRVVDALLTNFHLPKSTLLALVMGFAGVDNIRRAYRHAIEHGYRFYSYGDAMLIR